MIVVSDTVSGRAGLGSRAKAAAEPIAEVPTTNVNSIPMELSRSESTKSDHQDSSELEGGEIVNDEENINPDLKLKYDYKEDQ